MNLGSSESYIQQPKVIFGSLGTSNGESAKTSAVISTKYCYNKAKAVLAAQSHLNAIVIAHPALPDNENDDLRISMLQGTGQSTRFFFRLSFIIVCMSRKELKNKLNALSDEKQLLNVDRQIANIRAIRKV